MRAITHGAPVNDEIKNFDGADLGLAIARSPRTIMIVQIFVDLLAARKRGFGWQIVLAGAPATRHRGERSQTPHQTKFALTYLEEF